MPLTAIIGLHAAIRTGCGFFYYVRTLLFSGVFN